MKAVGGRRNVTILSVEAVGNYAVVVRRATTLLSAVFGRLC
jgi:DUF971 family protein